MRPLCAPCRAARAAWLDSKPSAVIPSLYAGPPAGGAGLTADGKKLRAWTSTPADTWRYRAWRDVVRFHMDLIARACRSAGHVVETPPARVIQLDIFAVLEKGAA